MCLVLDILTLPMPKLFFSINPCLVIDVFAFAEIRHYSM